jgi:hypothetical protein
MSGSRTWLARAVLAALDVWQAGWSSGQRSADAILLLTNPGTIPTHRPGGEADRRGLAVEQTIYTGSPENRAPSLRGPGALFERLSPRNRCPGVQAPSTLQASCVVARACRRPRIPWQHEFYGDSAVTNGSISCPRYAADGDLRGPRQYFRGLSTALHWCFHPALTAGLILCWARNPPARRSPGRASCTRGRVRVSGAAGRPHGRARR